MYQCLFIYEAILFWCWFKLYFIFLSIKVCRSEGIDRNGINNATKDFYKLVEEGKQNLYPGSEKCTRLGFIIKLYWVKCIHGFTESAFGGILELIKEVFPNENLPPSFNIAKNMIRYLGLDFKRYMLVRNIACYIGLKIGIKLNVNFVEFQDGKSTIKIQMHLSLITLKCWDTFHWNQGCNVVHV